MKFNKLHDWGLCCLLLLLFIVVCIIAPIDFGMLIAVLVASISICSLTGYIMEKVDQDKKSRYMFVFAIGGSILLWAVVVLYAVIKFSFGGA